MTELAVSSTSLLVRPRCRYRPFSPTFSATALTKATTSCWTSLSISRTRSTEKRAPARISRRASSGIRPSPHQARQTASSTSSMTERRFSSLQSRAISFVV